MILEDRIYISGHLFFAAKEFFNTNEISQTVIRPRCAYLWKVVFMRTKEVAEEIGVGYQTLFRWLYAGKLDELERMVLGGATLRLWTKADIKKAWKTR